MTAETDPAPDRYAEALGLTVLAGAELERSVRQLHAQLLGFKNGVIQAAGEAFNGAYDGCWALLKAFDIPRHPEIATALTDAAALWRQFETARRTPRPNQHPEPKNETLAWPPASAAPFTIDRLTNLATSLTEQATRVTTLTQWFDLVS